MVAWMLIEGAGLHDNLKLQQQRHPLDRVCMEVEHPLEEEVGLVVTGQLVLVDKQVELAG